MGRRGPAPKPSALRIAGASHRRENRHEPRPPEGAPAPWSGLNDDAKAVYAELVATIQPLGVLTQADGLMLSLLANAVDGYAKCAATIEREGMTITSQNGRKSHPAIVQLHKYGASILQIAGRFGLSPADRVGLTDLDQLGKDAEQRNRDEYFFGRPRSGG